MARNRSRSSGRARSKNAGASTLDFLESDKRLKAIIDAIPILAWTARPDGWVDFVNQQWLDYTGLSLEEALGWGWTATVHADERNALLERWRDVLDCGKPGEFEARVRRFDGEYRWFFIRTNAERDSAGGLLKWYGTNTEIEDRRRAEQALSASEHRIRIMVDNFPALVVATSATGEIEYVNRPVIEYFGSPLEELKAWETSHFVHPDDLTRVVESWKESLIRGQAYVLEHRLRGADGVYRWFSYRSVPQRDTDGRLVRWYAVLIDIDDLKRAEAEFRSSERGFRLIVDGAPGMLFTTTAAGEVEFVSRSLLEYHGRSLEELQDWRMGDAVHPEDLPLKIAEWQKGMASGVPYELDERLRRADGVYRWFHFKSVPLRDARGNIVRWYGLLTDMDDLKRTEAALRKTQAQLSRATHLAAMSELSASIAHEINQPLSAILTNGHASQRWLSSDPPNIERAMLSAERIVRDVSSAAEAIRRMRSLFKHAPPIKATLDLNQVIVEVCNLLAEELRGRDIALQMTLQCDLPHVAADRLQMQQVLVNLVRNGIDAMDGVQERPKQLMIGSRTSDAEIVVDVSDQGIGVSDPEAVFEPFYTTKENGMGIGLAICRSILEAHGGRLWAARNAPFGATFGFALRIAEQAVP